MKKSLAMFGLFGLLMFFMIAIFAPFADPWFFLLTIPMLAVIPHMDKIFTYLTGIIDDKGADKSRP